MGRVAGAVSHPIFARVYRVLSRFDERDVGPHRSELLAGLAGTAVEIGAGNGLNFSRYPAGIKSVVAVEPEAYLRRLAEAEARRVSTAISVRDDVAEALALPDDTYDAAVACLVLCTVAAPSRALGELRRVLKPGGELRFLEHVRAAPSRLARRQQMLDQSGVWPLLAGGCHCARDTVTAIEAAGFEIVRSSRLTLGASWAPTSPVVLGVARAAGGR